MTTRRAFLRIAVGTGAGIALGRVVSNSEALPLSGGQIYLPSLSQPPSATPRPILTPRPTNAPPRSTNTPQPQAPTSTLPPVDTGDDPPLLGPASGSVAQASAWLIAHCHPTYSAQDVAQTIVPSYAALGARVGLDWFLALAQLCHETGSLTSWWCIRPRRNPAGIGVTGTTRPGEADTPPGPAWAWHNGLWEEGVSFADWQADAIPAHLGRLLAYALPEGTGSADQQALIAQALSYRPLLPELRGIAPTITGLNGRWAYPGVTYGQMIVAMAERIRQG